MRQILTAALFSFATLASVAQKNETIEGNGKLVTRDVAVTSFDVLDASGIYELKLSQGATESVKIEADENLQEYFTVKNVGSKLVIDMDKLKNKSLRGKNTKMKVYVTFKTLKSLDLSMVGNVRSEESLSFGDVEISNKSVGNVDLKLTANKMTVDNQGVGNITLSGKAENAVFRNQGVGSLKAGDLTVQTIDIHNTGVGNAEVNAAKELKVEDSFLGKVRNLGAAPTKKRNKQVI
ncbi:MAG: hypothetical protein JWP27_2477 [Flaviaesturariibacter sp.]|nr:hypothetical protein [Flaviaesturariibacter sp.]